MSYDDNGEEDILLSPIKGVDKATGELSWLYRNIMKERDITPYAWERLMEKYLNDPTNHVPHNGRDRSSTRGNLNKALKHPKMTWKIFKTGLKFLGALHFKIELHILWKNNQTTVNAVNVLLVRQNLDDKEKDIVQ